MSYLVKLHLLAPCFVPLLEVRTPLQVLCCEFCKILKVYNTNIWDNIKYTTKKIWTKIFFL